MALNSISSSNRVVEQGNTYQYEVEPAVTTTCVAQEPTTDGGVAIFDRQTVNQWHGIVHFSKRYRYVGLDKDSAESLADNILSAYTITPERWAVGLQTVGGGDAALYCYVTVGSSAPLSCATVTPVHVEGELWEIEVDVNATIETYTSPTTSNGTANSVGGSQSSNNPPSVSTLKGLVSGIVNFPEISSRQNGGSV